MKKAVAILCVILLVSGVAMAKDSKKMNWYAGAGLSLPMGTFGDQNKMGFHGSAGLGLKILESTPAFELVPRAEFHSFSIKSTYWGANTSGSFTTFMIGADAKYDFSGESAVPYVLGGLGLAFTSTPSITVSYGGYTASGGGGSSTNLYINFGGGAEFKAGENMKIFAQARYVIILTSGSSSGYIPLTVGVKF